MEPKLYRQGNYGHGNFCQDQVELCRTLILSDEMGLDQYHAIVVVLEAVIDNVKDWNVVATAKNTLMLLDYEMARHVKRWDQEQLIERIKHGRIDD